MSGLSALYSELVKLYQEIEDFEGSRASEKFNNLVRSACLSCSQAVSTLDSLDLFSKNEALDDLTSNEIKYITVPALLGYFLSQRNENRKQSVEQALTAYKKFHELCSSYGMHSPTNFQESTTGDVPVTPTASVREAKIKRYKEMKALKEKLQNLASAVEHPNVDEEIKREYHLTLVRHWLYIMEDEVNTLRQEQTLLSLQPEQLAEAKEEPPRPPMQPFILTRDAAQAAVFGAGYPSLPTMTLDQFFSEQVKRGIFPTPKPVESEKKSSPGVRRIDPSEANRAAEEEKAAKEDALEDADDPEHLSKARNFDEFKDMNRRGCGNRMNRG